MGKNPFEDIECDVVRTFHYTLEFFDDAVHIHYPGAVVAIPRLSNKGCDKELSLLPLLTEKSLLAWTLIGGVAGVAVIAAALLVIRKRRMTSEADVVLV